MDFNLFFDGVIALLTPISEAAFQWIDTNLPDDAPCFGAATAIEARYAPDIINGIRQDGLTVAA